MRVQPGRSQDWPTVITSVFFVAFLFYFIFNFFIIERETVLVDNTKTQQKECEIEKCEEK